MLAGALAERELDRVRLGAVVERRGGAVGVDVVDLAPPRRPASASAAVIACGLARARPRAGRSCGRRRSSRRSPGSCRARGRRAPARRRSRSSTSTAAPSPITKPSRRASNGREMPLLDSASSAPKAARASGVSPASEPPATTASASPVWSMRSAAAERVRARGARACSTAKLGPRRPWRIDSAAAPALLIISGTDSGETRSGPRSRSVSWPSTSVAMPPMPVPEHAARRGSGHRAARRSQPASASASRAGRDRQLREAVGAARLLDREEVASGRSPRTAPSPSRMPHTPALQRSYSVRAPTPSGVTAPTPVTTTASTSLRRAPAISLIASSTVLTSATSEPFSSTPKRS